MLGLLFGLAIAAAVVTRPDLYRYMLAAALIGNLLLLVFRKPQAAAACLLLFLPVLALVRRVLILDAGWSSYDPLLLVSPIVAVLLLYRHYVAAGARPRPDFLFKLVVLLGGLTLLQAFNPLSGTGLTAGIGGLLFVGAPLLWFFVGREIADRATIRLVLVGLVLVGVAVGLYGLWQTKISFPSWDQDWVDAVNYTSLKVGNTIRPFGTFSSSAEYASFLGVGLLLCVTWILDRKWIALLALPWLAWPLFLVSGRSVVVLALLSIIAVVAIKPGNLRAGVKTFVAGIFVIYAFALVLGPVLDRGSSNSSDQLSQHQVQGLLHPLDPNKSTAVGHWGLVIDGVKAGFSKPLGEGTGATNQASGKLGTAATKNTEFDISNAFVGLGAVGGVLFMLIVIVTLTRVIKAYAATRDTLLLATSGVLIVTLGQWLNGGYYALSALAWFLIGWATRELRAEPETPPELPGEHAAAPRVPTPYPAVRLRERRPALDPAANRLRP